MANIEIKQIFDFLEGNLSAEEHEQFASMLKDNDSLKREVEAVKQMKSYALSKKAETQAKIAVSNVHKRYATQQKEQAKPQSSIMRYLAPIGVAAAILIGLFLSQGLLNTNVLDNQEIYSQYFDPVDLSLINRSDADQSLQLEAENAFNSGDYDNAINKLQELQAIDAEEQLYDLYLALSFIEKNEFDKAETLLNPLLNDPEYTSEAYYFKALSKLKQSQRVEANNLLKNIQEGSTRYKQAQEIIQHLRH